MVRGVFRAVLALGLMSMLAACESQETKIETCTKRGIEYFKQWGTYPKLRNGKDADTVARERCKLDQYAY